jgi:hypothetical protein
MAARRPRTFLSVATGAIFVALAVLAPTGAQAVPYSLKVAASDGVVSSSCEFYVSRFNPNNTGPATVTGRLTARAAEIKPSFFSPRKVATISVTCTLLPANAEGQSVTLSVLNNGSSAYKSRYVTIVADSSYQICANTNYILRDGNLGSIPVACNPS